jgi:hypothetical protein
MPKDLPQNPANNATGGVLEVQSAQTALWVELPQLRSKSNFRRGKKSKNWSRLQGFEDELAISARAVRPMEWPMGDPGAAISSRPSVVAVVIADTLLDTGNVTKSVFDALEGVLYHTDASIRAELVVTNRKRGGRAYAAFAVCDADEPMAFAKCAAELVVALSTAAAC